MISARVHGQISNNAQLLIYSTTQTNSHHRSQNMATAAQPNMNAYQVVASESSRPFANAADILYDDQNKPYILLDALMVDIEKRDHLKNPQHVQVFLATGENIGVINKGKPDRLLPKFAGGTPDAGNLDPATGFRVLGKNSLKARIHSAATGQNWKWQSGAWKVDTIV